MPWKLYKICKFSDTHHSFGKKIFEYMSIREKNFREKHFSGKHASRNNHSGKIVFGKMSFRKNFIRENVIREYVFGEIIENPTVVVINDPPSRRQVPLEDTMVSDRLCCPEVGSVVLQFEA